MSARTTSVIRRLNWLDQARYHARLQHLNRNFTVPTCHRCALPCFEDGKTTWQGPPLVRVGWEHAGRSPAGKPCIEIVGYCDHERHSGPREDAIRVEFDWDPDDDDIDKAFRSCVFFPRGSEQEGAV